MNDKRKAWDDSTELFDDVLLEVVNTNHKQHSQSEVDFARAELLRRGYKLVQTGTDFHIITPQGSELMAERKPSSTSDLPKSRSELGSAANASKARIGLNWSRIWKYTLLLFVVTFVIGFLFGMVVGIMSRAKVTIPAWLEVVQAIVSTLAIGSLFVHFIYKQEERTLANVLVIALIGILISLLSVPLFGMPVGQFILGCVYICVLLIICVPMGLSIRARREIARLKVPPSR